MMEEVKQCLLCGSGTPETLGFYPSGEGVKLCECGLIYLSPRPSDAESYSDGTFDREVGRNTGEWDGRTENKAKIRHDMVVGLCGDFKSILDVGCSDGKFLDLLEGVDVMGIDPTTNRDEFIRGEFPQSMPKMMFDVITMFHSVEHVADPVDFISSTHKHLADDGYLIVEYPDIGRRLMRDNVKLSAMLDNHFHLFEFTQKTMVTLLDKCGYDLQSIVCFSNDKNNTEYKNVAMIARKR